MYCKNIDVENARKKVKTYVKSVLDKYDYVAFKLL